MMWATVFLDKKGTSFLGVQRGIDGCANQEGKLTSGCLPLVSVEVGSEPV